MPAVPHIRVVVMFCTVAVLGYAVFSVWAINFSGDKAIQGDVGGTWKSFAVAAFAFWIGASSGGKARDVASPPPPPSPPPALPPEPGAPLDLTGAELPNQGERP